jgi:hypothetical protein
MLRIALLAAVLALAAAAPASAKLTVGIGEQNAAMFHDKRWLALKAPDVRYVMPWDALKRNSWEKAELDNYMNWARAVKARVMITFGHSRRGGQELKAPSRLQFIREFRHLRRLYPELKTFQTWNEGNHGTQPVWNKPELAARYFDSMRRTCPECKISAPSMLDAPSMTPWIQRFKRGARYSVKIWSIHNHIDANRHRTSGTREFLRVTGGGQVWFSETGGIVNRWIGSRKITRYNQKNAVRAIRNVFKLAKLNRKRITRIYVYQWMAPEGRRPRWDSGLVGPKGQKRPSLQTLQAQLRQLR